MKCGVILVSVAVSVSLVACGDDTPRVAPDTTAAPAPIADEVAAYKTAYDEYVHFLSTVDFDLDQVFSTEEGTQLAIDTSHSLTPAIVGYVENDCGLSFGDEEHEPPTTADG